MTQKESIQRRGILVDEERNILSCLRNDDNASWECKPVSFGERVAKAALKTMEKYFTETQEQTASK
jgi:hypothetical protein